MSCLPTVGTQGVCSHHRGVKDGQSRQWHSISPSHCVRGSEAARGKLKSRSRCARVRRKRPCRATRVSGFAFRRKTSVGRVQVQTLGTRVAMVRHGGGHGIPQDLVCAWQRYCSEDGRNPTDIGVSGDCLRVCCGVLEGSFGLLPPLSVKNVGWRRRLTVAFVVRVKMPARQLFYPKRQGFADHFGALPSADSSD